MRDMEHTMSIARAGAAPMACHWCTGPVDVKSRHVSVAGSAVRIYCSDACLQAAASGVLRLPTEPQIMKPRPTRRWLHVAGIGLGIGALLLFQGGHEQLTPASLESSFAPASASPAPAPEPPPPLFGPDWPPSEADWVADLAQDAWIHPL